MKFTTKFNLGQTVFFIINSVIYNSEVESVDAFISVSKEWIRYEVKQNKAGTQYTTRFSESDVFGTKQELLDSL